MKGRYCTNVYYQCRYTTKPILSLFDNPKMKTLIDSNHFLLLKNSQRNVKHADESESRFDIFYEILRLSSFCGKLFPKPSNKFYM